MKYWLFKSEPDSYSWDKMKSDKITHWDGVRNYQANNNMKLMEVGDLGFFYHSNKERSIKGIVRIIKKHYPDYTDKSNRFGMVDIQYYDSLSRDISLKIIKDNPHLQNVALIKQSRLSVMPISNNHYRIICKMSST